MKVKKRSGELKNFDPNKILKRINEQSKGLSVNADEIAVQTMQGMYDGISTLELDELAASIAHRYTFSHPHYNKLAARLIISRLHKETTNDFFEYLELANHRLSNSFIEKVKNFSTDEFELLLSTIDFKKDYNFDYFGISHLIKSYLLKNENGYIIERPQFMFLRVAIALGKNINEIIEFYNYLSNQFISAATPILFNAGTKNQNMISCNLTYLKGDSIEEIFETYKNVGIASSDAAGIGLCIDNLRSRKTKIKSTGGNAHGVLGFAKVINELMVAYNQGGKRPGSCALYLSVWHKDIMDFLELKLITGEEKLRARDLFLAVNVPDNFMSAVENDEDYYLFCPYELEKNNINFNEVHGEEFNKLYQQAVQLGIGEKVKAQDIYKAIIKSQIETGVPYVHFIDRTNENSLHSAIYGKIKQSNLCIEIVQYSDPDTTAQCCLGSIPVQKNITSIENGKIGKESLKQFKNSIRVLTIMLNRVIDNNEWSTKEAEKGGIEQRAIAIGIQGLANLFNNFGISFSSKEARDINDEIAETIYNTAKETSAKLSKEENITFKNCDIAIERGLIDQPLANSLFVAYMPTAGTAQIIGSSESFEPLHSNMFIRELEKKEYNIINEYLVRELEKLNLWNEDIKDQILRDGGSIQNIDEIPLVVKENFRTIWEIPQKDLIDLASGRQKFIDQSQSMNLFLEKPTGAKVASMLMYSWKSGLKTGIYYLRTGIQNKANVNLGVNRIEKKKEKPNDSLFNCEGCSA